MDSYSNLDNVYLKNIIIFYPFGKIQELAYFYSNILIYDFKFHLPIILYFIKKYILNFQLSINQTLKEMLNNFLYNINFLIVFSILH